jgi:hypothetical protein
MTEQTEKTREEIEFEALEALVMSKPVVKSSTDQAVSDWLVKNRRKHTKALQS